MWCSCEVSPGWMDVPGPVWWTCCCFPGIQCWTRSLCTSGCLVPRSQSFGTSSQLDPLLSNEGIIDPGCGCSTLEASPTNSTFELSLAYQFKLRASPPSCGKSVESKRLRPHGGTRKKKWSRRPFQSCLKLLKPPWERLLSVSHASRSQSLEMIAKL